MKYKWLVMVPPAIIIWPASMGRSFDMAFAMGSIAAPSCGISLYRVKVMMKWHHMVQHRCRSRPRMLIYSLKPRRLSITGNESSEERCNTAKPKWRLISLVPTLEVNERICHFHDIAHAIMPPFLHHGALLKLSFRNAFDSRLSLRLKRWLSWLRQNISSGRCIYKTWRAGEAPHVGCCMTYAALPPTWRHSASISWREYVD